MFHEKKIYLIIPRVLSTDRLATNLEKNHRYKFVRLKVKKFAIMHIYNLKFCFLFTKHGNCCFSTNFKLLISLDWKLILNKNEAVELVNIK